MVVKTEVIVQIAGILTILAASNKEFAMARIRVLASGASFGQQATLQHGMGGVVRHNPAETENKEF